MRYLAGFVLFLLALGTLPMVGCGDDASDQQGLRITLQTIPTGTRPTESFYILGACFEITGPSHPTVERVCGGIDYASAERPWNQGDEIVLSVEPGAYQVLMRDDWILYFSGTGTALPFPYWTQGQGWDLTSPNPQTVQVITDQMTVVKLQFYDDYSDRTIYFGGSG